MYAGRCDYHSSETASDRDVRNTQVAFRLLKQDGVVKERFFLNPAENMSWPGGNSLSAFQSLGIIDMVNKCLLNATLNADRNIVHEV